MKITVYKNYISFLFETPTKEKASFIIPLSPSIPKKEGVLLYEENQERSDLVEDRFIAQEGEYEIKGVLIKSFLDPENNRLFYFWEDPLERTLLYLGEYHKKTLPIPVLEFIPDLTCLFFRSEKGRFHAENLSFLVGELEPKLVFLLSSKEALQKIQKELSWPVIEEGNSFSFKKNMEHTTLGLVLLYQD